MGALKLSLDVVNQQLVQYKGSSLSLEFTQGSSYDVQLRFVEPSPTGLPGATTYQPTNLDDILGPRLGIWNDSSFTLDDDTEEILALTPHDQFTLNTVDATDPYYEGTFNTATEEIGALGDEKTHQAYFAVGLVKDDLTVVVVLNQRGTPNCILFSQTDEASGVLPVSASTVHPVTLPVYFKSPDGERQYILAENETHDGLVFSLFSP